MAARVAALRHSGKLSELPPWLTTVVATLLFWKWEMVKGWSVLMVQPPGHSMFLS